MYTGLVRVIVSGKPDELSLRFFFFAFPRPQYVRRTFVPRSFPVRYEIQLRKPDRPVGEMCLAVYPSVEMSVLPGLVGTIDNCIVFTGKRVRQSYLKNRFRRTLGEEQTGNSVFLFKAPPPRCP